MNSWSANENTASKFFTAPYTFFFLLLHHKRQASWLVDFLNKYSYTKDLNPVLSDVMGIIRAEFNQTDKCLISKASKCPLTYQNQRNP
jgi:hypothetical protein